MGILNQENIKLEASELLTGLRQKDTITTVADVAGNLGGTHFLIEHVDLNKVITGYYVWFDTGSDTDPTVSGRTGIEVTIASNDTANTVATKIKTALDAVTGAPFSTRVSGAAVTVEVNSIGAVTAPADADSGFTFANVVTGSMIDLGATTGGIGIAPETSTVEIKADQTGEQTLDVVATGVKMKISTNILELEIDQLQEILGNGVGDSFTPTGGTKVVGQGDSKNFKNLSASARELVIRPINAADNSRNYHIWKAIPIPGEVNKSGTEVRSMPVEFECLLDLNKVSQVKLYLFGDGNQDFNL